ncbi:MAG: AAA family ATPase [Clostridia bacterium]|nr:AAA family ATPase [Clostridia bacterium]
MAIKINSLEFENVKRIKAVKLEPSANGLTVIGGKNGQGKTSVLDTIAWMLGGNRFMPSEPTRKGSVIPPSLRIVMDNGLIVERSGKNSSLKVIDPNGNKSGQRLLDEFISSLALDLPAFMNSSSKEKAKALLQIIGVGEKLVEIERKEVELYNRRHAIGQIATQKANFAKEMTSYPDAPNELVSASELIRQQQEILARNGENQKKRENLEKIENLANTLSDKIAELNRELTAVLADLEIARKDTLTLHDESTEELERNIADIESINIKVRANLDKEKAEEDAKAYQQEYDTLSNQLDTVRKEKFDLLHNANLPLEGLSVEDGELTYNGFKWDNMSGAEQLKVSTAIVRKLNPNCGFVLLDKLEQMDVDTLNEFGQWLEAEGLQAIATRVSTGDECSVIIEDGYIKEETVQTDSPKWKAGEF